MRTLTETPSGQSSSRSARCAATAPAAASRARVKEKKNASPCVSISCPPAEPSVSRRMLRSRPRTSEYRSPSSRSRAVDPSMSVNRNVTVPLGSKLTGQSMSVNRLAAETSPYLLQHADNPVDWYPWGEEALSRAREEDKPVLLSVGYAACHWCHVMEHESFEDDATAALMNDHFVCVKVDREERPDVDAVYMDAVVGLTGHGGWPMTVFLTPGGEPFYGGTYFPPEPRHGLPSFRHLLAAVAEAWEERRGELTRQAGALTEELRRGARAEPSREPLTSALLTGAVSGLRAQFDPEWGGFVGAPKFPPASTLEFLLRRCESQL